jgi:hypothetical protein
LAFAWGAAWAPLGVLTGVIVDSNGSMDEPWIAVGAYPGFLCGLVFASVLGIAERRHRLVELSLARAGAWGVLSGLVVMSIPFIGFLGTPNTEHPFWVWRFLIVAVVALLSALSAAVTVLVARLAKRREIGSGSAA